MQNDRKQLKYLIEKIVKEEIEKLHESYQDDVVYRAFVQPFQDVVDTAQHGLKSVGTHVGRGAIKLAKQHVVTFIPFFSTTVAQIGAAEEKKLNSRLAKIDKEYADVMKRNWDTLRTRDVSFILFMMDPKIYLGSSMLLKAPEAAFDVLDSLVDSPAVSRWHNVFKELNKKVMPPTSSGAGGSSGGAGFSGSDYYDGGAVGWESKRSKKKVIQEKFTKSDLDEKAVITLKRLLKSKEVQNELTKGPKVKEMREAALELFIDKAQTVAGFTTIDDFKNHFGSEFDKIYNSIGNNIEDKNELEKEIVPELKKVYIQMIVNYFNTLQKSLPEASNEINQAASTIQRML
jgi:hypothetical protein